MVEIVVNGIKYVRKDLAKSEAREIGDLSREEIIERLAGVDSITVAKSLQDDVLRELPNEIIKLIEEKGLWLCQAEMILDIAKARLRSHAKA